MMEESRDELEIVDLDTCPKMKSVLIGAAVTLLLSMVPFSWAGVGLHLAVAGMLAAGHYVARHKISISFMTGAKLGVLATLLGSIVFYFVGPFWLLRSIDDEQWNEVKQQILKNLYENGQAEQAAEFAKMELSTVLPYLLVIGGLVIVAMSVVGGFLGGGLGAMFFKKGPEAR